MSAKNAVKRTSAGHTPGPWLVLVGDEKPREMSRIVKAKDREFLIAYVVRESMNKGQQAEDDATATLIASAPELAAALENIIASYDANDSRGVGEEIERARVALANAVGH